MKPILPRAAHKAPPGALRPFGDGDGAVIPHAGRYARECVLVAFEMIGGTERMAAWAENNPTEFYTRLYGKLITREVELQAGSGIEDLLSMLDGGGRTRPRPSGIDVSDADIADAEIVDE